MPKSSGAARQTRFASDALNKRAGMPKPLTRPRVSMPTPTPGNGVSRYPSLSRTKNPSIPSAVGRRPIGAPTINGGRTSPNSDVESVASASVASNPNTAHTVTLRSAPGSDAPKRPPGFGASATTVGTVPAIQAMKRSSSVSSRPSNVSNVTSAPSSSAKPLRRLQERSSLSLSVTPEERSESSIIADKENQPDVESTPKAQQPSGAPSITAVRRRVAPPL